MLTLLEEMLSFSHVSITSMTSRLFVETVSIRMSKPERRYFDLNLRFLFSFSAIFAEYLIFDPCDSNLNLRKIDRTFFAALQVSVFSHRRSSLDKLRIVFEKLTDKTLLQLLNTKRSHILW
jgi:hypothetical protein